MRVQLDSGEVIDLGTTATAPTIGIIDYSRRVTDDYGVTTVVERGYARRMSVQVAVPFDTVDAVQRRLADLRATSALWIADDRFGSLSVRGFYKEFSIDVASPPISYCTLSVEGLTGTDDLVDSGNDPAPTGLTSTLRFVQPVTITNAQLVASNVAENDAPEWSANVAYARGVRVIKAATHRIYESVAPIAAGDDPEGTSGKWLNVGPTSRWAMFDQALGSVTTANRNVTVTVNAGAVDSVALLDVVGDTVRVQATGYDRTLPVAEGAITFLDLPANAGQVTVTVIGAGVVTIGTLIVGKRVALGLTEASPTAGITDYSRKVVDDFGEATVVPRAWAKRMTANALIRTKAIDFVMKRIAAVRATPCLWIGQDGLDSLTIYGFFKDFSIEVGEGVSKLALTIEGLSTAGKVEPLVASTAWPDVTDPTGTKPADNATNGADPTSPLGSTTVGDFEKQLATARKQLAYIDETTIPTINVAVAAAGVRIDGAQKDLADTRADVATKIAAANGAISAAQTDLDAARDVIDAEIARAKGAEEDLNQRVDSIAAGGDYDDSSVRALIQTADTARADGDRALGQRVDLVQTDYKGLDTATNARITDKVTALSNADQALGERIDTVTADYKGRDANVNARVTDAITTLVNTDTALGQQINNVEADYKSRDANVNARVTDAITTLVNTDSALGQQINNVTADYQSRDVAVNARVGREVLALTNADTAIGQRIDSAVADYKAGDTAANGRIDQVATTAGDAKKAVADLTTNVNATFQGVNLTLSSYDQRISALSTDARGYAGRTASLESRVGNTSNYASANASFTAWPDGVATPSQWVVWASGTFTREGSSFQNGAYMVGQVVPDGNDAGLATAVFATKGYWVIEASVWCSAGNFQGAGAYIDNLPSVNFSTTPDNEGNIGVGGPGVRNWSLLVKSEFVGQANLYAMGNWSAFGATSAKTIHWLKCGARPATDGEIKAQKASVDLPLVSARVKQTEDTLADLPNRYAAAQRTAALEAQVQGGADSNLLARANDRASAIADAKVGALAQTVSTLSARVGSSNLLSNSTIVSTDGWSFVQQGSGVVSPGIDAAGESYHPPGEHVLSIVQGTPGGNGAYFDWQSAKFPADSGRNYQFYVFGNSHRCVIDAYFIYFNASGQFIGATPTQATRGPGGFGNIADGFVRIGVQALNPPPGTVSAAIWLRKYDTDPGQDSSYAWFWRPFVSELPAGQTTWSPYSVGSGAAMEATLVQQAGVLAGINGRTSVYWSVTGTTPDGSTTIQLSKADGSPGLFYIGANLLVDGNAIFNGTVTIKALDRSTMTATTSGSVSGNYGGAGQPSKQYIPNLGADMFIRSGGSIYMTFTGNIGGTTNGTRDTQPTIDILNAADNSILAAVPLPEVGFGQSGRLDNYTVRILNTFGDITIRWRVAVRSTANNWSNMSSPSLSVYWTAL